jgi:hypothetical protein
MIERKDLSRKDVAHRAYELYTQRGCEPGKDVEDWVRAEEQSRRSVRVNLPTSRAPGALLKAPMM